MMTLDGQWQLSSPDNDHINIPITLPGDVHSALLAAALIPDPYHGCNERDVQWVGEKNWTLNRTFNADSALLDAKQVDLTLSMVDTVAKISINGQWVMGCSNMFRRYRVDIRPYLVEGENTITIELQRADIEAKQRAEKLPFPVPWAVGNNQIPHMNTLRKTQCHAGWDWGICLLVSGIYDSIVLTPIHHVRLTEVRTEQTWQDELCILTVNAKCDLIDVEHDALLVLELRDPSGQVIHQTESPVSQQVRWQLPIFEPQRWWPAGYGEQPLYSLSVTLFDGGTYESTSAEDHHEQHSIEKRIGLRELALNTQVDDAGSAMTFVVNGKAIMAKGANWIPLDAMPSQHTPERYRQLLDDAKAANMNMIRVWGGGMYERDVFYRLCDELGLLVWQDLMFACALYPSTPEFLADVAQEVEEQVRRLSDHPSLALWCGDNEVIGAIGWYPESRTNREKYVVNYDRLNRVLQEVVEREDPTRRFWASSPCNGELDFGDAWHDDNKGDMHFWDVWHSGKSFDAYHSIKPRFCSEFGYQSWPSLPTVKTFAEPQDWNVTSPTFEQHQKNGRGNSIMTEMFTRYFRFPSSFDNMLYLSQVQQALAIKTASEYWRANKPVCRGILYWQLNDCWPVSSWSSIEHNGRWKQLHYHAKHFFAPQLAAFVTTDNALTLHLINDEHQAREFNGEVVWLDWDGNTIQRWEIAHTVADDGNDIAWAYPLDDIVAERGFFYVKLNSAHGTITNNWFGDLYKRLPLPQANIEIACAHNDKGEIALTLTTDKPAFFVQPEVDGLGRFSDASFTLLPDAPRTLTFTGDITLEAFEQQLRVYHLAKSHQ
uniref:beta-mannosidase n=1 Tax=Thaumasiovibrio occultus TaxID=1891184 RepID=UPI000B361A82|nr:glycoside hydrolase family 2 protein [Thaumasiovibrio occultus]